ncbi:hypothetical protein E2493_12880 [Sphingomonas parva]|uniref:Uncharacterized protein n=1 Tax=Sphingomonas parva TaxID=2555898 RepID=A0A4Y8ZPD7_9SPHN|nr:hypothetical protein [Sphingomonas parva]TFI57878.1 hypothetical protein E2493_12880 [Sphingomonas parva]
MSDRNDRGADRAETARRSDDSDIIDTVEDAPAFGGSHGGNLQRDIGARDEVKEEVGEGDGVTRVRDSDKPEQANLPRFNP